MQFNLLRRPILEKDSQKPAKRLKAMGKSFEKISTIIFWEVRDYFWELKDSLGFETFFASRKIFQKSRDFFWELWDFLGVKSFFGSWKIFGSWEIFLGNWDFLGDNRDYKDNKEFLREAYKIKCPSISSIRFVPTSAEIEQ